jgi:hypothetical protein
MAAAKAVTSAAGAIGKLSDVAGGIEATEELYSEIDSEATVSEEGERVVREIERVESMAREAGYTEDEIASISEDLGRPGGFQEKIRGITRAIRTGKRLRSLVSSVSTEKRAQNAQIDTAANTQQSLMAELEQTAAVKQLLIEEKKKNIEKTIEKRRQITAIRSSLAKKGARVYGNTEALTFPRRENAFESAFEMAEKLRFPLIGLIILVIGIRVIFYQFSFKGPESYGDLLRDTLVCAFLLFIFPDLVRAILDLTDGLSSAVVAIGTEPIQPGKKDLPSWIRMSFDWKVLLSWLYEWTRFILFGVASFLINFGLSFMIVLFPIVIFASQALNFAVAWPVFLGSFIVLAIWPIFWNATGLLAVLVFTRDDATHGSNLTALLLGIVQFVSPFLGAKLLTGEGVMKTVQSASAAISGVAGLGAKMAGATFKSGGLASKASKTAGNAAKKAGGIGVGASAGMGRGAEEMGRNLGGMGDALSASASRSGRMAGGAMKAAGHAANFAGRALQFPDRAINPEKYGKDPISKVASDAFHNFMKEKPYEFKEGRTPNVKSFI